MSLEFHRRHSSVAEQGARVDAWQRVGPLAGTRRRVSVRRRRSRSYRGRSSPLGRRYIRTASILKFAHAVS